MSSLHEIVPAMPVQSGIQLTPSTSITQAYVDHVDNLFRSERATLENQFKALTFIKNASVASEIITAQGTDAKTDLTNDQLRGSIVAYHDQTAQLRREYDQISKSSRPKTEQDSRRLNDSYVSSDTQHRLLVLIRSQQSGMADDNPGSEYECSKCHQIRLRSEPRLS